MTSIFFTVWAQKSTRMFLHENSSSTSNQFGMEAEMELLLDYLKEPVSNSFCFNLSNKSLIG